MNVFLKPQTTMATLANLSLSFLLLAGANLAYASGDHDDHSHEEVAPGEQLASHHHDGQQGHDEKPNHNDAGDGEGDEHGHEEGGHEEEGRVTIKQAIADKAGIKTQRVSGGTIKKTLTVYGKAVADTSKISHIKARFAGIISRVNVAIGDKVKKGQILAVIESNESLNRYNILAPFSGTITDRHAAQGEQTQDQALFTLANFDHVWAEFQIFPTQSQRISVAQEVTVSLGDRRASTRIKHLIPSTNGQPFMIARALLDNSKGQWTPGLLIEGKVVVNQIKTALRVNNLAIQELEGNNVVFLKEGNEYQATQIDVGLSDNQYTEILGGLKAGSEYVVENSYLIKADIEKSGAAHEH